MIAIIPRPERKKNSHYGKTNFELVEMAEAVWKARRHFEGACRERSWDNHALTSVTHTCGVFEVLHPPTTPHNRDQSSQKNSMLSGTKHGIVREDREGSPTRRISVILLLRHCVHKKKKTTTTTKTAPTTFKCARLSLRKEAKLKMCLMGQRHRIKAITRDNFM